MKKFISPVTSHFFSVILITLSILLFAYQTKAFHDGDGKEDRNVYIQTDLHHQQDNDAEVIVRDFVPFSSDQKENLQSKTGDPLESTLYTSTDSGVTVTDEINVSEQTATLRPQRSTGSNAEKSSPISENSTTPKLTTKKPTPGKATSLPSTTIRTTVSTNKAKVASPLPSTSTTESSQEASSSVSSTIPTTTIVPPKEKPKTPVNNLYCLCDLHRNTCDMNCCCDEDCTEDDRLVFSKCDEGVGFHDGRSVSRRQRSCFQSFVFFKQYETYNLQRTDHGLLCILRDNNKEDNALPIEKIAEVRDKISQGKIPIRDKYGWGTDHHLEYEKKPYYYGSPILGVKGPESSKDLLKKFVAFGLPSAYHDTLCSVQEPVLFLENFDSHCKIKLSNFTKSCETMSLLDANFFLENLQIIANPNDTDFETVEIRRTKSCNGELCTSEADIISELSEFASPTVNKGKKVCQDVLVKLNLTVYHLGPDGISEIIAKAELEDVPINTTEIVQEYRVNFRWSPETEHNSTAFNYTEEIQQDWPRSGNPGYIVGKPVIMGEKVKVRETLKNDTKALDSDGKEEREEEEMILVFQDPSRWLTIQNPGICSDNPDQVKRKSVLFDYGHSSTCSLNSTRFKYCEDLQIQVAKILFGAKDPLNFDKRPWYVAAYGNSNPGEQSEWVPLEFENFQRLSIPKGSSKTLISRGCDGIVLSMHITIYYAFVGSVEFPQARITGVLFELGDPTAIPSAQDDQCIQSKKDCQRNEYSSTDVSITTTATFKDITSPPIVAIPKWPILSIRLPADFFYPFSSPSSACVVKVFNMPWIMLIIMYAVLAGIV